MKAILLALGTVIFVLAWPFWMLYFRLYSRRSRVVVVAAGSMLLVKSWLGTGAWGLPGGGAHRGEELVVSAIRELKEETGIDTTDTALRFIGRRTNHRPGFSFQSEFFVLELPEKPKLHIRRSEIADAKWIKLERPTKLKLDEDAQFALRTYQPYDQTELL